MNEQHLEDFIKGTTVQIKNVAEEINQVIACALFGFPLAASTFTIRREYSVYSGEWVDIPPRDGLGMRTLKYAIKEKWNIQDDQFEAYTKEDEDDKYLYITFHCYSCDVTFKLDVCNPG